MMKSHKFAHLIKSKRYAAVLEKKKNNNNNQTKSDKIL